MLLCRKEGNHLFSIPQLLPMMIFRNVLLVLALSVFIGCKGEKKKPSFAGDEPVEVNDFIEIFQPVNLPISIDGTRMGRKEKDSMLISRKVFNQFVPDSVLAEVFPKNTTIKIYPLARVDASKDEKYLFAKAVGAKTNLAAAYIIVFDSKDEFANALVAWRSDQDRSKTMDVNTVMDKKFTITKTQVRKNADGTLSEGRDIYAYSPGTKSFSLIMTDAIGDKVTELINPIDTFSRKHKFSGDYIIGKSTLVSLRDGRKNDRLSFFIHFEKDDGECTGELKGEAMIRTANTAEYRQPGDLCALQFRFTTSSVTIKELEGCGSHRGLRCSFDGVYPRKKEPKPKTTKKKTTNRN
jgi:hypothetical protein